MSTSQVCRILSSGPLALYFAAVFATAAVAGEIDVRTSAPLESAKIPSDLDKATGIGPRFRFTSAPPDLSLACASSIQGMVNDGNFVNYPNARTLEEFRSKADAGPHLRPDEAAKTPVQIPYKLAGEGRISNAMCFNAVAGTNARGFCTGTVSGQSYTIVYHFDPVVSQYDNVAVGKSLDTRLSVDRPTDQKPELDCATKLTQFVTDIDDVLARHPGDILDVYAALDRHFPLHGCSVDIVSRIIKTSKYFRSMGQNSGTHVFVFVLNSDAPDVNGFHGVKVSFGLTPTGDSEYPYAGWSPPFL
jgi:hypothetical protein